MNSGDTRLRLDLAYDGTGFAGWARQPGQRTIQDEVESALETALRLPARPNVTCAARTDAGVHARGQVAHVDVPTAALEALSRGSSPRRLELALRGLLPDDVALRRLGIAPADFDARFAAVSRRYSYRVADTADAVDPVRRNQTLVIGHELDLARMNEAAAALLGSNDFSAFCRKRDGTTAIRTLHRLEWSRHDDGAAVLCAEADAFCRSMVRSLVGCLLPVGVRRQPVGWPQDLLAGQARSPNVTVMPGYPLVLEEVRYPERGEYAARVALARRRREPLPHDARRAPPLTAPQSGR